jgi:hypothetical protein
MKLRDIAISGPILQLCQNDALKQNSPPGPAVKRLLAVEMHSHATVFSSVQSSQITIHKILFLFSNRTNP